MLRRVVSWTLVGMVLAGVLVLTLYLRDMNSAYQRVSHRASILPSPYGDIEYLEGGRGPAVLVIHGSGGGYDQGELLAHAVLDEDFRWIAPSRFGYLRSTFQPGATFDEQAHAYAFLLSHLEIHQVAVVAISHGCPSALLFAAMHPERVHSLALISCGVASSDAEDQAEANQKGDLLTRIFRYDFPYWAITKVFRAQFIELMGANSAVIARLSGPQQELVDQLISYMNPVSMRADGVVFDNQAALPGHRIAAIQAPTLMVHAVDDTLQLFRNAEFAVSTIPGARLLRFETGGHLVVSTQQPAIRAAVRKHIRTHAPPAP